MKSFSRSCPCVGTKRVGKILRTLVVVSNILFWFAGCSVLSIAIWVRFVDVGTKNYYSTFYPLDTGLYVVLVASVLFLVVSFVGTCAANTKNEMMLSLYIAVLVVVSTAEIISLIVFSLYHDDIENEFLDWYKDHFIKYSHGGVFHNEVVDHVQSKMKCCGLTRPSDYFNIFDNQTIPNSCMVKAKKSESILRPELHASGCLQKLEELVTWLLKGWPVPFTASMMLIVQITGITSSILFLQHIFTRRNSYEGNDEEDADDSKLIHSKSSTRKETDADFKRNSSLRDLPRPKVYRIAKASKESSYGFSIRFDDEKDCYLICDMQAGSNAEYAGISERNEIVEINGMLVEGVSEQWVQEKMNNAFNELRLVLIDEKTDLIYKSQKVSINLKNIEGVTDIGCEYRPRLCRLSKGACGFGFHLLYLEDREGEYIEDVAPGSSAHAAGLNVGDRILEVNGINIEREKSSEVVKRIRISGNTVNLLVVDPKTDGYYRKKGVTVTASMSVEYFQDKIAEPLSSPRDSEVGRKRPKRNVNPRYCCLAKTARQDYGLYVVIDNTRIGQVIRWVDCGGPADKAGLRIGDRIVEVNGHSVEYESHQHLISCISVSKTVSRFIVVDEEYDQVYKRNKPRLCHIFKESSTFGFCIRYQEKMGGHYVEMVDDGGPAQRAGLQVHDRIIQINGLNVERDTHQSVLDRLRTCPVEVILLVIDARSSKHYKKITEFKSQGLSETDYNDIPTFDEPLFVPDVQSSKPKEENSNSLTFVDSLSVSPTHIDERVSTSSMASKDNSSSQYDHRGYRSCTVLMSKGEKHGFFLSIDRNRNGQVLQEIEKNGAADRAGLRDGDRIISINGENIDNLPHEEVVCKIRQSGRKIVLTVIDQRSDNVSSKHRPYLFRIVKDDGGYGFYLWHDENGHYVEDVTFGSPADKSGMRAGDRIIEVNGVNVEEETHEEVFYRVKACKNVVTLLAVDLKTFRIYKSQAVPANVFKADFKFSGSNSRKTDPNMEHQEISVPTIVTRDLEIRRCDGEDFGFNMAFSNSFMEDGCTGSHIVHWVEEGGPAYLAGLRDGDKIIEIDGHDVRNDDHEQLVKRLYQVGKLTAVLSVQYEDTNSDSDTHAVTIRKTNDGFGFHLWFDENGHYIEDVTIGSSADNAGLKIGDRLLKVNGRNVEDAVHANVVNLVRQSEQSLNLLVFSVQNKTIHEITQPEFHTIKKQQGTFGFAIAQDEGGFHFDFIAGGAPAETSGIRIGDRLLEVNGEQLTDLTLNAVVSKVRASGEFVSLNVMPSTNNGRAARKSQRPSGNSTTYEFLPDELMTEFLGEDDINIHGDPDNEEIQSGTDMRNEQKPVGDMNIDGPITLRYSSGEDNVAFVIENDTEVEQTDIFKEKPDSTDPEGRYLEEKVSRAASQSTKTRRKSGKTTHTRPSSKPGVQRRLRNLTEIERRLSGAAGQAKNRTKDDYHKGRETIVRPQKSGGSRNERPFRLVTSPSSLSQKWNFEQRDSRRPGETQTVTVGDSVLDDVREETENEISMEAEEGCENDADEGM